MILNNQNLKLIALALLCTTIITGSYSIFLQSQINEIKDDNRKTLEELNKFTSKIDLMIDYGNGTQVWYNDTRIVPGESLLNITMEIAKVEFTMSEFGAFINSINGVEGTQNNFWIWNYYEDGWNMGMTGADKKYLHEGDIVSWEYTDSF
jgi:hypothetical protein